MTDRRLRRLEISAEVARAEAVPDDLDAAQREPYTIPSTRRRRTAGGVYLATALLALWGEIGGLASGLWFVAALLGVVGVWHLTAAWRIEVLDPQALETATREVGFPVGHASAAVGFDGWRAKPIWNVLVFSAEEPPTRRALVRVNAVDGSVVETYEESVTSG